MKIVLISYPGRHFELYEEKEGTSPYHAEPLAPLYLGAMVSENHDVELIDTAYDDEGLEERVAAFSPDIVGVMAHSITTIEDARQLLTRIKKANPDVFVAVGGAGPTSMPEEYNNDTIDVLVLGEGEITFKELIETIDSKEDFRKVKGIAYRNDKRLVFTEQRPLIRNLDDLPLPNRSLYDKYLNKKGFFLYTKPGQRICSSRGCPYRCIFCAIPEWFKNPLRYHSPQRIVEEIKNTKAPIIEFVDNDFLLSSRHAESIADLLEQRGIKKDKYFFLSSAGSTNRNPHVLEKWRSMGDLVVTFGAEAADDKYLKKVKKPFSVRDNDSALHILDDLDIFHLGVFIIFPEFERDDFKRLADYVNNSRITVPIFSILTPLPGSPLYVQSYKDLVIHDWYLFDEGHVVLSTKLPRHEFDEECDSLFRITLERFSQVLMTENVGDVDLDLLAELEEPYKPRQE